MLQLILLSLLCGGAGKQGGGGGWEGGACFSRFITMHMSVAPKVASAEDGHFPHAGKHLVSHCSPALPCHRPRKVLLSFPTQSEI